MSQKSKAKAALKREHAKRQKQMEDEALQRKWEKLLNAKGGFARSETKKPVQITKHDVPGIRRTSDLQLIDKRGRYDDYIVEPAKPKERLSPEMQERDDKAAVLAKAKAMRVAPLYNKGGYQYVTDGELKDFIKGAGRRRP